MKFTEFKYYPEKKEVDKWMENILQEADAVKYHSEILQTNGFEGHFAARCSNHSRYVKISPDGMAPFYCYLQQSPSFPAPLLVHLPGYGAEITHHPDIVMQGFTVLHVNPLGYATPDGYDKTKKENDIWPVFSRTIKSRGEKGYKQWLMNVVIAVNWAQTQKEVIPERVSFFGTSQGGGTAMLLASLYQNRGVRCVAANQPAFTNFPLNYHTASENSDIYKFYFGNLGQIDNPEDAWYALGLLDILSHIHRLEIPVLMTGGGEDVLCDANAIKSVFEEIDADKMYFYQKDQWHGHTYQFCIAASAWFKLYA